jgi:hypothetical protein
VVVTAPVEVVIDELVLRGVREADGSLVVAAFRRHLAELLAAPGDLPPQGVGPATRLPELDVHPAAVRPTAEQDAEDAALRLAAAVVRAVLAVRR